MRNLGTAFKVLNIFKDKSYRNVVINAKNVPDFIDLLQSLNHAFKFKVYS